MSDIRDNYHKILVHPTKPIPYIDQQNASLQSTLDRYEKALREIESCCDPENNYYEQIWRIANNVLNKD